MANRYPATPSFGGAFPSLPYPSLRPQQNGHNLFAGRPPVTSPMGTSQPTSGGNPQSINASNFAENAQIPSPGLVMPPIPPHPFPQDLFKQLVNSSLPPPPPPSFPPVPIPNLGFSAYQPPPALPNNFTLPQNLSTGNLAGSTGNLPENAKGSQAVLEKPTEPIVGSREEGELSDGELDNDSAAGSSQTAPQEGAAKLRVSSRNKAYSAGHYPASQNQSNHSADMGNALQGQRESVPEISSLSRQNSGSSYDPPSVTTPDFVMDHSNARDGMSPQMHGKSSSQMRELAKGALLSLAPHGIRYSDLVKEGVDPDLLQQLYEEIGIRDCRPEPSADSRTYQATHTPDQKAVSSGYESDTITRSTYLPDKPASDLPGIPAAAGLKDSPRIQQSVAQSNSDSVEPLKDMETPLRQTESVSIVSTNPPVAMAASNVAMERKDRIAQLLAAKTGKPAPIRRTPDATPVPVQVHSSLASMPPASNSVASGENKIAPNVPQQQIQKSAKNKAQTELVRQKMESLKKEAEAKARAQNQSQTAIAPRSNIPAGDTNIALTTPGLDQSSSTILDQHNTAHLDGSSRQTIQATSDFQSLTKPSSQSNYAYRIPGLFMTSDEPSSSEEQVYSTVGSQVDNAAVLSSDLEHGLRTSARDQSSVTGSLTETNLASLGNQDSSSRLPQKRPLASDSFDEPAPLAKRPFGRKDSVEHIEIDVSEEENDDGSDGIGMDIDEDSQTSGLVISSATPSKEASEPNIHLSQSLKPSERSSVQQQTASSSLGLSTPTKEVDKEDLWRAKNQEIEAMRKRIAEMEQRQKAKRGQSQAQSPQSSLPGTPATPKLRTASPSQLSPNPGSVLQTFDISLNQPHSNINAAVKKASNGDYQPLVMNPLSRMATESPSHGEDLRKKMARRKELQDGLPNLDAEVKATQLKLAQTKARLAAIKREAEKREAEIREARKREAEIAAEAMKLEEQLNMGLKGRTRFSEELQSLGTDLEVVPDVRTTFTESLEPDDKASNPSYVPPPTNLPDRSEARDISDVTPAATYASIADADSPIVDELNPEAERGAAEEEELAAADSSNDEPGNLAGIVAPTALAVVGGESYKKLNGNSRSQSQTSADPESYQSSIMPRSSDEEQSGNFSGIVPGLDNDDASVSMSDSGTDEYEPAEIPDMTQYSDIESEAYEPEDGLPREKSDRGDASDVEDDYEPAEEVEPMEVDLRSFQHASISDYQHPESRESGLAEEQFPDPYSPGPVDKSVTDDINDGLEVSEANTLTVPQDFPAEADSAPGNVDVLQGDQAAARHFTAYESPLFFSKNFRFDPNFPALVAGGYSSLTYSNKIDPSQPLCPTEAEGGSCTDPECEEQHFQQMALPDDKILVEMSSARDFRQADQRDQFLIGLKQVIAELRSKGVKEFPTVASALAAYRRTFMASIDPNRAIPS